MSLHVLIKDTIFIPDVLLWIESGMIRHFTLLSPKKNITSSAGTGNPFSLGPINEGDVAEDVGSGSGFDALIASHLVGPEGRVVGIDMTHEMLSKARSGAKTMGANNIEFREGYADQLPLPGNFADVLISNGVLNLGSWKKIIPQYGAECGFVAKAHPPAHIWICAGEWNAGDGASGKQDVELFFPGPLSPDKEKTLRDWARVLKPGGRLYIGDILVSKKIPQEALDDISLWTG
jgi:SAM-dependent methyltransferase